MIRMFLAIIFAVVHLTAAAQEGRVLNKGMWRASLERQDGNNIVFNFEIKDSAHKKVLYIRNAGEHLLVDDIKLQQDSVLINLPFFESQIRALLKDDRMEGVWLRRLADNYVSVPFRAQYSQAFRWKTTKAPVADITGRWAVVFWDENKKDSSLSVGEFVQQQERITGTFLNPTGDYRYLEGVVDGDSLKLSCFDGGHAFLFTARIANNHTLDGGHYFSGPTHRERWYGRKDPNAKLPDEFSLTSLKKGAPPLNFGFRDINGNKVSFKDKRFSNKVVLIQVMGSWCPNCMDETNFLSKFYDQYHGKGVEIVGLAYERTTDFARSQNSLRSFQKRFQVKYPMLITGVTVSDSLRSEKTLPQLEKIAGFPTTIFVDRQGRIQKIHTGFSGPGTGAHYEEQKKEFYEIVDGLLGE